MARRKSSNIANVPLTPATATAKLKGLCIPKDDGVPGGIYTPIAPDGKTRLRFWPKDVLFSRGDKETLFATIGNDTYRVVRRKCGLGCKCDAQLKVIRNA